MWIQYIHTISVWYWQPYLSTGLTKTNCIHRWWILIRVITYRFDSKAVFIHWAFGIDNRIYLPVSLSKATFSQCWGLTIIFTNRFYSQNLLSRSVGDWQPYLSTGFSPPPPAKIYLYAVFGIYKRIYVVFNSPFHTTVYKSVLNTACMSK